MPTTAWNLQPPYIGAFSNGGYISYDPLWRSKFLYDQIRLNTQPDLPNTEDFLRTWNARFENVELNDNLLNYLTGMYTRTLPVEPEPEPCTENELDDFLNLSEEVSA